MENPALSLFSTTLILLYISPASSIAHSNSTDLSALLAFQSSLIDRSGVLASNWTNNTSFCGWTGISCTPRTPHRVASLNLSGFSLQGTISPHLSNLSFVSLLDLSNNSLHGSIPHTFSLLPRLSFLNLGNNLLSGPIPPSIFNISSLALLSLATNNLSGTLPPLSNHSPLPRLQLITLSFNQLSGTIPTSFAFCPGLQKLSLSYNQFSGTLPSELPHGLSVLYLSDNNLSGSIPAALGNYTSLTELSIGFNRFTGWIPAELGSLRNLWKLKLTTNLLTGTIPISLANSSMLSILELSNNSFSGAVPPDLFNNMPNLTLLNLGGNQLVGKLDFVTPLTKSRNLENLSLWGNKFIGEIPNSIGNLSDQLLRFTIFSNQVRGFIPSGFGNLTGLILLDLSENKLQGPIPSDIMKLQMLQQLLILHNNLEGAIPRELGQMKSLGQLYFSFNNLSGLIPDTLGNLTELQQLGLATNSFTSSIPESIWSLQGLHALDLSHNSLTGNLDHMGILELALDQLDLSSNRISGSIPSAMGENLRMLEYLDLSHNSLLGTIPVSLGQLINIKVLNLSSNTLSGAIPESLAELRYLAALNLSFNRLQGKIPQGGAFLNITKGSLSGNLALCGKQPRGFPPCSSTNVTDHRSHSRTRAVRVVIAIIASALLILLVAGICLVLLYKRRRKRVLESEAPVIDNHLADQRFISYQELVRATKNFSETNLLGRGGVGSVFKGCLDDGLVVAVKVLNLEMEGASESFDAECRALCMARHRNLVKIISTCSNLDFKALILQFMPNGSLDGWLYSSRSYLLTLDRRMGIMLDVALALEYLHDHHIVHCDLKPSNVLLDEEMTGHVGDFGIAKLLMIGDAPSRSSLVTASAPGTIGYMAPEYGLAGRVSRKADVYSYGILLLEMFTRRKPTDGMFGGESSLRQWVYKSHPDVILETVDTELLEFSGDGKQSSATDPELQCLRSVLELGLSCSEESPNERVLMKDAVARLGRIRADYVKRDACFNT